MNKAYKTTFNLVLIGIISYLIRYFSNVVLAKILKQDLYGDYALALRILFFIGSLMLLGTNTSAKRFFVSYLHKKEHGIFKRYINWNVSVILKTSLITTFIAVFLIVFLLILHDFDIQIIQEKYHLAVFTLSLAPIIGYCLLIVSFYLCLEAYYRAGFLDSPLRYILILCPFLIFKYLFKVEFNFFTIWLCLFLSLTCLFAIELAILKKIFPNLNETAAKLDTEAFSSYKKLWFSTSIRLAGNNVIVSMISFIDLLLVEIISKNEHSVAYYAAVMIILNIMRLIPNSCMKFVVPQIRKFDISEQYLEVQNLIRTNNRLKFTVTTITFLIIVFGAKFLLGIFGEDYTVAQMPLIILSIGFFVRGLGGASSRILAFTGKEKFLLKLSILELLAVILLGALFTYCFGILGLAGISTAIMTMRSLICVYYCKKKQNINALAL